MVNDRIPEDRKVAKVCEGGLYHSKRESCRCITDVKYFIIFSISCAHCIPPDRRVRESWLEVLGYSLPAIVSKAMERGMVVCGDSMSRANWTMQFPSRQLRKEYRLF